MTQLKHKIICGDCIEAMKDMEKESIDLNKKFRMGER